MSEKVLARDPEHEALLQSQFLFARFGGNFQKRVEDIMEVI